ncbi:hypothetical protein L596_002625 [Steinernema carpocapsae]|uniref:Histone deacetylase domain-containing protein n=1 Tax=Steinernema carpocapsae TaxID=34508 RepID=A0A4U8UQA4_STECR|nr:hypothetical protein L596_002625 [Steinernema carpocapsae]
MSSTTLVTNRAMLRHKCEWDETHIERPERLEVILDCLDNNEVCKGFVIVEGAPADMEDIFLVHDKEYVEEIKNQCEKPIDEIEGYCTRNEDIYLNSFTYECAVLSAGSCVQALTSVLGKSGQNAFAAVRPPGHHASQNAGCGFCIFNNVAICAKKALEMGCKKVLIVDWDVHAGQGTQYCIAEDDRIRLISSHRYEEGKFWPQLPESGICNKYKNTINLPLNEVGHGDSEYVYFFNGLIIPVIHDLQPDLILVSCGFDAALGDPEGEMKITPAGYGYMMGQLAALDIPLCVLLEGGYFIDSVKESFKFCMEALGTKKSPLPLNLGRPSEVFVGQVLRAMNVHQDEFPTIKLLLGVLRTIREWQKKPVITLPEQEYCGEREFSTPPYPTRNLYPPRPENVEEYFRTEVKELVRLYVKQRQDGVELAMKSIFIQTDENSIGLKVDNGKVRHWQASENDLVVIYFLILQHVRGKLVDCQVQLGSEKSRILFPVSLKRFVDLLQPNLNISGASTISSPLLMLASELDCL